MSGQNGAWLTWVVNNFPAILAAVLAGLTAAYARWNNRLLNGNTQHISRLSKVLDTAESVAVALQNVPSLSPVPTHAVAIPAAGGGGPSPALALGVLPAWSERLVITDDGSPADQHDNLCGEVAVAAIVAAVHGVPTDPTDHRTHAHGLAGSALTDAGDIAAMLQHCSVGATGHMLNWESAHLLLTARLAEGCYSAILMAPDWVGGALHWVVPVGVGPAGYNVFDPWSGGVRTVGYNNMVAWYSGQIVTTSARPHYDARQWVMPPN